MCERESLISTCPLCPSCAPSSQLLPHTCRLELQGMVEVVDAPASALNRQCRDLMAKLLQRQQPIRGSYRCGRV